MAVVTRAAGVSTVAPPSGPGTAPQPYRWTREAYHRLIDAGILGEDDRVELIEGELLWMPVPNPPHATSLGLVEDALRQVFGAGYVVRNQSPLALSPSAEPEPDVAVVRGNLRAYATEHPTTALLVVEISDTTLSFDRLQKGSLYARAGIPEYWIVNLRQRRLEVYRDPAPAPKAPHGYAYQTRTIEPRNGAIAPLAAPDRPLKVADLLP